MKFKNLIAGLALCSPFYTLAVSEPALRGIVTDENGSPIEFANVVILNLPDSTLICGTVTDQDGLFSFTDINGDVMRINYIGYAEKIIDSPSGDLGTIMLEPLYFNLSEVTVKGSRPVARIKNDAISVDVKGTYLANTGTATEVLGKMPFVSRNGSEIEVIGKGTPIIYINGRQVRDMSELEQLSSSDIKNVEVITTPGARYDSTVNAVIRVSTVTPTGEGFSLSDRTVVGYKHYAYLFEQANFNYCKGGFDIFGMLNYENYRERMTRFNDITQYLPENTISQQNNGNEHNRYPVYQSKIGVNYISENFTAGAFYDFSFRPTESSGNSFSTRLLNGILSEELDQTTRGDGHTRQHLLSAYFYGKTNGWQLTANFDALWKYTDNKTSQQEMSSVNAPRDFSTCNDADNRLLAGNISAVHPLWKGQFTIGADISDVNRNDIYLSDADFIDDDDTQIKETTCALFGEISQDFGKISVFAGLRWEYTDSRFFLYGERQNDQSRRYNDLSPSAGISFPVGNVKARLNYSRKTTWPAFEQLSSAIRYIDRYSYESGNPNLQPIYRDYLSLSASWKDLVVELDYTSTDNYFMWQTMTYDGHSDATLLKMQNMPRFNSWSAMANYSPTFGCWHPSLMAAVSMQDFKITHNGATMKFDKPLAIVRLGNAIHLPFDIWLNGDLSYRSAGNAENLYLENNWTFDLGVYKSFNDDTWSIKLQLNDVFDSSKQEFTMYDAISQTFVRKNYDTRDLQLTIRYNFNTARSRYKGQGAGSEEKSRL